MRLTARLLPGLLVLLAACAGDPWERYDSSLHDRLKYATPEAEAAHMGLLAEIVEGARRRGRRPPPGVCAEYGYLLARQGDRARGQELLAEEARLYPEAALFAGALARMARGEERILEGEAEPGGGGR